MNKTLVAAVATFVVDAMNDWVESHTHRCWGITKTVTERYDYKPKGFWLRHQDVQSITSIQIGWPNQSQSTVNASSYYPNSYGRVTMIAPFTNSVNDTSRYFNDLLSVTYVYGVATVPNDLKLATLGIAAGFYNWAVNDQKDVTSISVGSYKQEMSHRTLLPGRKPEQITADANWAIIDKYKMQRA